MKKENLITQMNKASEGLAPSNQSQIRVWNKIEASLAKEVQVEKEPSALSSFFSKRRFLIPFLIAPVCFLVISLPLILNTNNKTDLQDGLISQPEDSVSDDGARDRDYYYDSQGESAGGKVLRPSGTPQYDQSGNVTDNDTKEDDRAKEKTGTINIEVTDFDEKFEELNNFLVEMKGYTLETRINSNYEKSGYLKVRVPVDRFDEFTAKLREISYEVVSEDISIVDKQGQMTSYEQQIAEIDLKLAKPGLSQSEKVQLELQKLNLQKQMLDLKKTTDYATLTIYVDEHVDFDEQVSDTGDEVSKLLVDVVAFWIRVLIWIFVPVVALLPVLAPLYLVGRSVRRKLRKNK